MMVISAPLNGQYGIKDLYLGTPAVINSSGIAQVIQTHLSPEEHEKMKRSAEQMQAVIDGVSSMDE